MRRVGRVRAAAIVLLTAATAFLVAYAIARPDRHRADPPVPSRAALPSVLESATRSPAAPASSQPAGAPGTAAVSAAVRPYAGASGFGGRLLARVTDAQTGAVLFDRDGSTPAAPASTAKLLTAAAVLAVHASTYRFTTTVRSAGSTLVLVGGGDPTLSAVAAGKPTTYPDAARISDLAAQVRASKVSVSRIVVDGSLFTGPSVSPAWDPSDMGTNYGAPITAVMADAAQQGNPDLARSTTPDVTAGHDLAAALGHPSLPVTVGATPSGAKQVASVRSAPLGELIDQMLQNSDNIIADVLARQVAVGTHRTASFTGATTAIRTVLARFGVAVGRGMKDGSGLASGDRVSPAALVSVLRLVAGYGPPASARLRLIASSLPVAAWSGTLADRFTSGAEHAAAGRVRAKTGTLSTVSSLAGLVRDRSGRLLVYSLDADQVIGTIGAEAALDAFVTALARCGCG